MSNSVNTSSGQGAEKMGIEYHSSLQEQSRARGSIRYGDIADLAKMAGIIMGGQCSAMDGLMMALPMFDPSPSVPVKTCPAMNATGTPCARYVDASQLEVRT